MFSIASGIINQSVSLKFSDQVFDTVFPAHALTAWRGTFSVQAKESPNLTRDWLVCLLGVSTTNRSRAIEWIIQSKYWFVQEKPDDSRSDAVFRVAGWICLGSVLSHPVKDENQSSE